MKPRLSYTIWFTQRTGSSLLCKALEATEIAGKPSEWLWLLNVSEILNSSHDTSLQKALWKNGSTSNGIFGLKYSFHEPHFSQWINIFRKSPNCPQDEGIVQPFGNMLFQTIAIFL